MNAMEKQRKNISRKNIDKKTKEEHFFLFLKKRHQAWDAQDLVL
jgi:hypothetical protein